MFGPHLIIDGSKCDTAKLADRHAIERILSDYPHAIGMTRIGGPYMFEYQSPDPAYSGISGLVVIAESHIAIHTFPALDYFAMDIFSCKNFDHEKAIQYVKDALDVREMDRMLIQRGLSFRGPHHGPLGATDELIAATAERNQGLGVTIGSLPANDPLSPQAGPRTAGRMIWPTYGLTPDIGTYGANGASSGLARSGASKRTTRRVPANAAALGAVAPSGLTPVQPVQLNPTASVSGVLDRMTILTGPGRRLGRALARWEALARQPDAPIVVALGPHLVAQGLRDIIADLIHRGHISAIIAEDGALLADCYESLGYRHYLPADGDDEIPVPGRREWAAARTALAAMLDLPDGPVASRVVAAQLGIALRARAPRPGIASTAAERQVPIFAVGEAPLAELGIGAIQREADVAALGALLAPGKAGLVAFGTTEHVAAFVAAAGAPAEVIAVAAPALAGADVVCDLDATVALPLLATGLAQRVPERPRPVAPPPELVAVG